MEIFHLVLRLGPAESITDILMVNIVGCCQQYCLNMLWRECLEVIGEFSTTSLLAMLLCHCWVFMKHTWTLATAIAIGWKEMDMIDGAMSLGGSNL